MRLVLPLAAALALSGCAAIPRPAAPSVPVSAPVEVQIIAFNDFHGALEPPRASVPAVLPDGTSVAVPAGGAAYLATAIAALRRGHPNSVTVSAGDLTSASPFASSQFLDEPAVLAMNAIGLDFNAVGNHEFDRGPEELKRLQQGGCAKFTGRTPCRVDAAFPGARFAYLAANVRTKAGETIFPASAIRRFGKGANSVSVGFIGLTLKETPTLVVPSAVAGLSFASEAETINALVPKLRAQGADAIVVLIHQGVSTKVDYNDKSCAGVSGDLLPILARLDPAVDLVVSGHTHNAYICNYARSDPARPLLFTSAGRSGMLVTDVVLGFDPASRRVTSRRADNIIVQSEPYTGAGGAVPAQAAFAAFAPDPALGALVARYVAAAEPIANRVVGRMIAGAQRERDGNGESTLGSLVADAQLAATEADIAFMNSFGLRADLVPGPQGAVTYGQLYAVQPFGNVLQAKGMTGAQIRAVLEQQFASGANSAERPNMLQVSRGFAFAYDLRRPAGHRVIAITLGGRPIEDARLYRVGVSNFLAAGGDNFTAFTTGTDLPGRTIEDVDALEARFAKGDAVAPPPPGRITRIDKPAN